jgi:hypothetical protein
MRDATQKIGCCHGNCNQGRACPVKPDTDSLLVSACAAVFGALLIASPFALWMMGYPQ